MRVTKGAKIIAGTVLLALGLAACGSGTSADGVAGADQPVRMKIGEPQKLFYPADTTEAEGAEVMGAIFAPLVKYDENKQVIDFVADSISSTDNKVWTIKIEPGFTWHNGEKLVAQNYVDAWNYAANQENAQGGNYFFARILGYDDLNPGEGKTPVTTEMKGLRVIDNETFRVTLSQPFSQFRTMLGYTVFYPLPKAAFGDDGKITEAYARQPIGQGYFKMDKPYNKGTDQTIELTRYEYFPEVKPKFEKLQFRIYTSAETAWNDLQGGTLDILEQLPPSAISTAKELGDRYIDQADAGVGYVGFPIMANKAYENPQIRQAISMAIDRKTITQTVFSGTRAPADDFINPLLDGYRPGACTACAYDPAQAKRLYDEAGGPKQLELASNMDGGHKEWIEAVANNLRSNLGIEVTVRPFEKLQQILDELDTKKYGGMYRMGWSIDYPSAENYLTPMFSTGSIKTGSNFSGYSNTQFDELVAKGDTATSQEESLKYYQKADDLLLRDLPMIPIFFYRLNAAFSEHVRGVKINLINQVEWTTVERAA
ncbi:peptide ABC transporter substrate-binding protein [Planomonospora parontospora]|uniref:peptide ABC transporter substrate-binding protein n=1 Tax=Planomonospora parontospora TaxID=58119 RepID=UPI00167124D4|nr:ABC transporter substrate-binding protein [Planomonospora parontospora]GGL45902.1 putative peptide ABC transporter DppA [Planomonospora parontospora subsp. antibiotica]GII18683.1 putative peptide ABC transporter DppA [Planomonospora parontospora subsp. antibiotica]